MIKGIHHVAFKCETQEQYDEMIYFYHELLGLPILRKWDSGIHLDCFRLNRYIGDLLIYSTLIMSI